MKTCEVCFTIFIRNRKYIRRIFHMWFNFLVKTKTNKKKEAKRGNNLKSRNSNFLDASLTLGFSTLNCNYIIFSEMSVPRVVRVRSNLASDSTNRITLTQSDLHTKFNMTEMNKEGQRFCSLIFRNQFNFQIIIGDERKPCRKASKSQIGNMDKKVRYRQILNFKKSAIGQI